MEIFRPFGVGQVYKSITDHLIIYGATLLESVATFYSSTDTALSCLKLGKKSRPHASKNVEFWVFLPHNDYVNERD